MRRREFIAAFGGATLMPLGARAQERTRKIGVFYAGGIDDDAELEIRMAGFRAEMSKRGWMEGRNLLVSLRSATADPEQIRAHAAELAALSPDVILVVSNPVLAAMRRAAPERRSCSCKSAIRSAATSLPTSRDRAAT